MTEKQFQELVNVVTETGMKPPRQLFAGGFGDWKMRGMLARFLIRYYRDYIADAIELFRSIEDQEVSSDEDIEQKAWSMKELGISVFQQRCCLSEALRYVSMALAIAESTDAEFSLIERGEIWRDRLELVAISSGEQAVINEADEMISRFREDSRNPHSYLYNAFDFKASIAYKAGRTEESLKFLSQALEYFPLENSARLDVDALLINEEEDKGEMYEAIKQYTRRSYLCWAV